MESILRGENCPTSLTDVFDDLKEQESTQVDRVRRDRGDIPAPVYISSSGNFSFSNEQKFKFLSKFID